MCNKSLQTISVDRVVMNTNPNEAKSLSQSDMIERDLWKGHKITQLVAVNTYRCMRLASRIADLKRKGVPIDKEMITTETGKHVARYFIAERFRHARYVDGQFKGQQQGLW